MAVLGEIPGVLPGAVYANRRTLAEAGVHRHIMMGISWAKDLPAESIVISGGYEDDRDWGDCVLYTGMGGNDAGTQVSDQGLERGNLALMRSFERRTPVRVIRGAKANSPFGPTHGLRYDGLFRVTDAFYERGQSGYRVWRFVLTSMQALDPPAAKSRAQLGLIQLYSGHCQICGHATSYRTELGAETLHVRPVTRPHSGADDWSNLLCVCPTHAVEVAVGAITIQPNLRILGSNDRIRLHPRHGLDVAALRYRAERYGFAFTR